MCEKLTYGLAGSVGDGFATAGMAGGEIIHLSVFRADGRETIGQTVAVSVARRQNRNARHMDKKKGHQNSET